MDNSICRAITLYSYHIPVRNSGLSAEYSTIGFFDGMTTKRIQLEYSTNDLRALWQHTIEETGKCDGTYSFQNIFGIAEEGWNTECTDEFFWEEETDRQYPLTMVVFLQIKEYRTEDEGIKKQCMRFNSVVKEQLQDGIGYTYSSVDKNEYIVCLKCKKYHHAVETIKKLHMIEQEVVYSYSVFSVKHTVLDHLKTEEYRYLFEEEIDSICLKGITNSIRQDGITLNLDDKYQDFCEKLAAKLYAGENRKEIVYDGDNKVVCDNKDRTYDILGDEDFRFIARKVKLGALLYEYRTEGLLSYLNTDFAFYFFSSGLVLNTRTESDMKIEEDQVRSSGEKLIARLVPKYCEQVAPALDNIDKIIKKIYSEDDKVRSIYYALYQLLQSFKVLELSPAKRYDFFSMFPPFEMLIKIVNEKLKKAEKVVLADNVEKGNKAEGKKNTIIGSDKRKESAEKEEDSEKIGDQKEIFDFIHKISMTFHSAQRTDLQFFQIQDFNVIVHYAPAKLRAFYAIWLLNLAELYGKFKSNTNKFYAFIFAPGMFGTTVVRQLCFKDNKTYRLMLVTLPDRAVYNIRQLLIVLSHEAAHIGCERLREDRHFFALRACARITILELHAFMLCELENYSDGLNIDIFSRKISRDRDILQELEDALIDENDKIFKGIKQENVDDECRREQSIEHIGEAFENMLENYGDKIIADYCAHMKNEYISSKKIRIYDRDYLMKVSKFFNDTQVDLRTLMAIFQDAQLKKVMDIFYYIEEEAFADLITILTLEHSMESYILSFAKDEMVKEDIAEWSDGTAVAIRMALVIETVIRITDDKWLKTNRPEFKKTWKEGELIRLCTTFEENSTEEILALQILQCENDVTDFIHKIDDYVRMYDPKDGGYTKNEFGFLLDEVFWDVLSHYLYLCAKEYISTLQKNQGELAEEQSRMADIYKRLKDGSVTDVMQIIEEVLEKREKEYKNNSFFN